MCDVLRMTTTTETENKFMFARSFSATRRHFLNPTTGKTFCGARVLLTQFWVGPSGEKCGTTLDNLFMEGGTPRPMCARCANSAAKASHS
jgi:hypothetical protein